MNAEDPLFILYTSGSTGKPKGVLRTTGGCYVVYAALTLNMSLIIIRVISARTRRCGLGDRTRYLLYGPAGLRCDRADVEGVPNWPTPAVWRRWWTSIRSIFYTAPTAIRALMAEGDKAIEGTDRSSLRILGCRGQAN